MALEDEQGSLTDQPLDPDDWRRPVDGGAFFAGQGALEAGFGSEEGKATAADYQNIAPPGSRMFVAVLDN